MFAIVFFIDIFIRNNICFRRITFQRLVLLLIVYFPNFNSNDFKNEVAIHQLPSPNVPLLEQLQIDVFVNDESDEFENPSACSSGHPNCNFRSAISYCFHPVSHCLECNIIFNNSISSIIQLNSILFNHSETNRDLILRINGNGVHVQSIRNWEISHVTDISFLKFFSQGVGKLSIHISNMVIIGFGSAVGESAIVLDGISDSSISSIIFQNNYARGNGAALTIQNCHNVTVSKCQFIENTAIFSGGALSLTSTSSQISIINTIFINNTALYGNGGAISVFGNVSHLFIKGSTFTGNVADGSGGAIFGAGYSMQEVYYSGIHDDFCGTGATTIADPLPLNLNFIFLFNNTINFNAANCGGGVFLGAYASNITFHHNTVSQNVAGVAPGRAHTHGAGLTLAHFAQSVSIDNCVFADNNATEYGGGLDILCGSHLVYIVDSEISRNFAGQGAGLTASYNVHNLILMSTVISDNFAVFLGGGIYVCESSRNVWIEDCDISYNSASMGSGVSLRNSVWKVRIIDTYVRYNLAREGIGGGVEIWSNVSEVVIQKCVIADNVAFATGLNGGGGISIQNDVRSVTIQDTLILRNRLEFISGGPTENTGGGGVLIYLGFKIRINACLIDGNVAGNSRYGGGVFILSDRRRILRVVITDSTISNNAVHGYAGGGVGVGSNAGGLVILNCKIINNTATQLGAGVWFGGSAFSLIIDDSVISNNTANYAAGLALEAVQVVVIIGVDVSYNSATTSGGGIGLQATASSTLITNTRIFQNKARLYGGAIYVTDSVTDITFSDVTVSYNRAANGGGAAIINGPDSLQFYRSHWEGNVGQEMGGAVYLENVHRITVNDSLFISNQGTYFGGGISCDRYTSSITVAYSTFMTNTADYGAGLSVFVLNNMISVSFSTFLNNSASITGGAIYFGKWNTNLQTVSSQFLQNTAMDGDGGGMIFDTENENILMSSLTFTENSASECGGGVALVYRNTYITLVDSKFIRNQGNHGGGLGLMSSMYNFFVTRTSFVNNWASSEGGGLYLDFGSDTIVFDNVEIVRNSAFLSGGGFFLYQQNSNIQFVNCHLSNNSAATGGGGYFSTNNTYLELQDCTIDGNSAYHSGGGMYIDLANNISLSSLLFFNNSAISSGAAVFMSTKNLIEMRDIHVIQNRVYSGSGGGIFSLQVNMLTMYDSEFMRNTAQVDGGAIYFSSITGHLRMFTTSFMANSAISGSGGAVVIYESKSADMSLAQLLFEGNQAALFGGSLFLANMTSISMNQCSFIDNSVGSTLSSSDDPVSYSRLSKTSDVISDSAYSDSAYTEDVPTGSGGAVFLATSLNILINNTTFDNNDGVVCGGLYILSSENVTVSDSLFMGSASQSSGSAIYVTDTDNISIGRSLFLNNSLEHGVALFWDSFNMKEPKGLGSNIYQDSYDSQNSSSVGTGVNIIDAPAVVFAERTGEFTSLPAIRVATRDYYGNIMARQSGQITIAKVNYTGCQNFSGPLIGATTVSLNLGYASFSQLLSNCLPEGKYILTFSLATVNDPAQKSDAKVAAKSIIIFPSFAPTPTPTLQPTQVQLFSSISESKLSTGGTAGVSVAASLLFLMIIVSIIYYHCYSKQVIVNKRRTSRLKELPLHRMLLEKHDSLVEEADVIRHIELYPEGCHELDYDGNSPLDIILNKSNKVSVSKETIRVLLENSLPEEPLLDTSTSEKINLVVGHPDWFKAIQSEEDIVVEALADILSMNRHRINFLVNSVDGNGRITLNLAGPRCKAQMLKWLYLYERYELRVGMPEHKSATSLVIFATDHVDGRALTDFVGVAVALKFMKFRDQFLKEVDSRNERNFDMKYVIPLLAYYDGDAEDVSNKAFREDAIFKGFQDYPYCIVMEAGTQSLKRIIDHEHLVGMDFDRVKMMMKQLTKALGHLHSKGVVHGDIKPSNILEVNGHLKIIDLDACVNYEDGDLLSKKFSSGYMPPETLAVMDDGEIREVVLKRSHTMADPSYDLWSLGCVFYLLCTGSTLFHLTVEDHIIRDADLVALEDFSASEKESRLSAVTDRITRNLLSQLLQKGPSQRLKTSAILQHPFFTGKTVPRLPGEPAKYDIFLSYRVESDLQLAESVYNTLLGKGLRVWWDKKCLLPGQNWEEGFCHGLVNSANFVCLISRGSVKNQQNNRSNFECLEPTSRCDNMLLEYRLALELARREMMDEIHPILIGDKDHVTGEYSNYFESDCQPSAPDIVVEAVESKCKEHLDRVGLGHPFESDRSVLSIYTEIISHSPSFIQRTLQESLSIICSSLSKLKASQQTVPLNSLTRFPSHGSSKSQRAGALERKRVRVLELDYECLRVSESVNELMSLHKELLGKLAFYEQVDTEREFEFGLLSS